MQSSVNLEEIILENLRQLPPDKQQEVLDFTEFLRQRITPKLPAAKPSLRQIAAMSLQERHQFLAQSVAEMTNDFLTDPELTEFAVLDAEDWETEHD
ncbi:DUF2281 domain-containing protein [Leptolyngbya ohadii]|uniref:DUF2281 domain-containing protein n=1 Tax=Leptolyngbya ohadii TaxID=1962290 RepID=UPI000B5A0659|nr:DUF2281 domain-containing protein [Leptolyngbya ohadii]